MSLLSLHGLTKAYGRNRVVDRIDLSLNEGEFVSLLGPSGCGKTTTLRMIAGFVEPTEGSIALDGQAISAPGSVLPPERRGMSMIFQSYAIWPNMTVAENVAFGLKLRKLPGEEVRRRVGEILEVVQMGHLAARYPAELSGGQQQRVALARAIVVKPAVMLLDEPLSNLDANLREEMRFEIRRLHDEFRITTVYVTHDQGEAMATSDRIAVMNAGRDRTGRRAAFALHAPAHALRRRLRRPHQPARRARGGRRAAARWREPRCRRAGRRAGRYRGRGADLAAPAGHEHP